MRRLEQLCKNWRDSGLLLPIWMENGSVMLTDQRTLPSKVTPVCVDSPGQLAEAIKSMAIRGSGAIGTAGAYGLVLAALSPGRSHASLRQSAQLLCATRPTAVNLAKTVAEILKTVEDAPDKELEDVVEDKVCDILGRQLDFETQLGEHGATLLDDGDSVLTHCNSGALAGSGYGGRAISVIRMAHEQGKRVHVFVSETRPYLQGARITAYELAYFGIPHTLITDGMSGYLMQLGKIQKAVVGSDRVAANGDLINKVGTYMHALAAKENGIPFYSATSAHTVDHGLTAGKLAEVEYRDGGEVTHFMGSSITTPQTGALYPAFDVTPARLITGYITEQGVLRPPYEGSLTLLQNGENA